MSGSSGGSNYSSGGDSNSGAGAGGNGGGGTTPLSCTTLVIITQIATPDPAFIASIHVGQVCSVQVISMNQQQVIAVMRGNDRLGGLVGGATSRLRECILQGTSYCAEVIEVNGPQIRVRISPV